MFFKHTQTKLSTETIKEEVQSVVLETNELESQEQRHAYAGFGISSESSFR